MKKQIIVAALVILGLRLAALASVDDNPCPLKWGPAYWTTLPTITVTGTSPTYMPIDSGTFIVSTALTNGVEAQNNLSKCDRPPLTSTVGPTSTTSWASNGIPIGDSSYNVLTSGTGSTVSFIPLATGPATVTFTGSGSASFTYTIATNPATTGTLTWAGTSNTGLSTTFVGVGSIGANGSVIVTDGTGAVLFTDAPANFITLTATSNPACAPMTELHWQRCINTGTGWSQWAPLTTTGSTATLTGTDTPGMYLYRAWNGDQSIALSGSSVSPAVSGTLYLGPVGITVDSSLNSGQPITSASNVCVGEPVTLTISCPAPSLIAHYQWTVSSNAIAYFNPKTIPQMSQVEPDDLTENYLYYYYVLAGTEIASCKLTFSNEAALTISGSLTIVAPSVQVTGTQGVPVIGSAQPQKADIQDGSQTDINQAGMIYTSGQLTSPPGGFTSGSACWVQILDHVIISDVKSGVYTTDTNIFGALDTGFPAYNAPISGSQESDTPDSGVYPNPPTTELDESFNASAYYMWQSDVPNSIWVPLEVLEWGWWGELDWNDVPTGGFFNWGTTYWDVSYWPPGQFHFPALPPTSEPVWTSVVTGGN